MKFPDRQSLYAKMLKCGELLIETQRQEETADECYHNHPTLEGLARLKELRQRVEELSAEYVSAIRRWREATTQMQAARAQLDKAQRVSKLTPWYRRFRVFERVG